MKEFVLSNLTDLMGNCPVDSAARACMAIANGVQHERHKGARLMGLASAFLIAAEEAHLSVTDLMTMARNCMNHAEGRRPEYAAVTEYINKEIING